MRILHILRSPIGGLFRHVRDLAIAQNILGHDVGVICSTEESPTINQALQDLEVHLDLGLHRWPMQRLPHFDDLKTIRNVRKMSKSMNADVVHGHGAKGGVYARLSGRTNIYTPHGGSLHYSWREPQGAAFLLVEKLLRLRTSGFIFVCKFEKQEFDKKVGLKDRASQVVYNGLQGEDFEQILPNSNAANFLFVGEMRALKGVDVLLEAIALLYQRVPDVSLVLVGDGPDLEQFKQLANELGVATRTDFVGRKNFQSALELGRTVVLPSRAESFPYVVLESLAAGRSIIASDVGGINEVLPRDYLVPAENAEALCDRLHDTIKHPEHFQTETETMRELLKQKLTSFEMATAVLQFYARFHN